MRYRYLRNRGFLDIRLQSDRWHHDASAYGHDALAETPASRVGDTGWVAGATVINNDSNEPAHSGTFKAWLGGSGTAHTDRIFKEVALPASAHAQTLAFFVHISTTLSNECIRLTPGSDQLGGSSSGARLGKAERRG